MQRLSNIIHEKRFDNEIRKIAGGARAADDLVDASTWALAKNPQHGAALDPNGRVRYLTCTHHSIGKVVILYTYDPSSDTVFLLSALALKVQGT